MYQGNAMPHGTSLHVRGNHCDLVLTGQRLFQRPKALGVDTVVIGKENVHWRPFVDDQSIMVIDNGCSVKLQAENR
jgi:hypothetical protein